MKKRLILTGMAISAVLASSMVGASEGTGLDEMNQLYQFALQQEYASGTYDMVIRYVKSDAGDYLYPQITTEHFPKQALAYEVEDFDADGMMELLLVNSGESEFGGISLNLEMYEVSEGNVYLAAQMSTGSAAFPIEEGETRCFTFRNSDGELYIGCEQYNFLSFTADGTSLSFAQFQYADGAFFENGSCGIAGSEFTGTTIKEQFALAGVPGVDENALLTNIMMPHDYLNEVETLFFSVSSCQSDRTAYAEWMGQQTEGSEYILGTLDVISCSPFVGASAEMKEKAYESTVMRNADYLYIASGADMTPDGWEANMYYLCPVNDYFCCVTPDGERVVIVYGQSAKELVDYSFTNTEADGKLPFGGGTGTIVWKSPNGLCAYSQNYQIYNTGGGTEDLLYMLNEEEVKMLLEMLNISLDLVPESDRVS